MAEFLLGSRRASRDINCDSLPWTSNQENATAMTHPIAHTNCYTREKSMTHQDRVSPQGRMARRLAPVSLRAGLVSLLLLTLGVPAIASSSLPTATRDRPTPASTAQIPASARVLYVNPARGDDSSSAGGSEANAYRTITYALRQASANTVIQLAPGTYSRDSGEVFPLTIPAGVILRGDESNKGQTVLIVGGGTYLSPSWGGQSVAVRAEKTASVRGVTISNTADSRGTGLWVEDGTPVIRNNTFTNSRRDGILIAGSANPTIADNVFVRNGGNGLSVTRAAQGQIENNVFQSTGFGIAVGGTSAPRLASNRVIENVDGIYVNDNARPVLRGNTIERNTRDGVVATINAQPDLGTADDPGENILRNNGRYDLHNATRTNTIVAVGNDINRDRIVGKVDFVATSIPSSGSFSDVTGHWAEAYIAALASQDIIAGFPDGTFRPSEPVTRAQFAAIVAKAFNPAPQRGATTFSDIRSGYWATQVIQTAYRGGFLAGYPSNIFQPEQRIPRVQILVALANGLGLSPTNTNVLSVYQDGAQIPSYAVGPVTAATERQLVVNYPTATQLNPNREATRAEVAALVYQALVNAGKAEPIDSPYVVKP